MRDQPIALSARERRFKEIVDDLLRVWERTRVCVRLAVVPFDCLKNASRRVPVVLGRLVDVKNRRANDLTSRDLSNSLLLS